MKSWHPEEGHLKRMYDSAKTYTQNPYDANDDSTTDYISEWLARLSLLIGLPFHYITPYEKMLPLYSSHNKTETGSMRFFILIPIGFPAA